MIKRGNRISRIFPNNIVLLHFNQILTNSVRIQFKKVLVKLVSDSLSLSHCQSVFLIHSFHHYSLALFQIYLISPCTYFPMVAHYLNTREIERTECLCALLFKVFQINDIIFKGKIQSYLISKNYTLFKKQSNSFN